MWYKFVSGGGGQGLRQLSLWICGIGFLYGIARVFGTGEIISSLQSIPKAMIVLLLCLQLLTLAMSSFLWYYLLRKAGADLGFLRMFSLYLAGCFVESVTPSVKFGGEAAKLYLVRRETGLSYEEITGVLLANKIVTLLPFLLMSAVVFICSTSNLFAASINSLYYWSAGIVCATILVFILRAKKGFFYQAMQNCRQLLRGSMIVMLLVSTGVWLLYPCKVYLIAQSLGHFIGYTNVAAATFTAYVVGLLPLLPGGLGSFEVTMATVLTHYALPMSHAVAVTLGARSITFWFTLVFSSFFALRFVPWKVSI